MEKYEKLKKIGEGVHGKVYKALHKASGKIVALKKNRLEITEEGIPASAFSEISLLRLLPRCIYIVRLLDVGSVNEKGKSFLYLAFEHLDCDLGRFIDFLREGPNPTPIPSRLIRSFMYQLCVGVAHCHSHAVLHRDLKPQNLLIDIKRGILKIADFGLGRTFTASQKNFTPEIGSLWYSAPEILMGSTDYSTAVDMWSVGCIFAELSRRKVLFPGETEFQQLLCIFRLLGTPQLKPQNLANAVPALEPLGVDLLSKMLQCDPAKRISAKAALQHRYFDSLEISQFSPVACRLARSIQISWDERVNLGIRYKN